MYLYAEEVLNAMESLDPGVGHDKRRAPRATGEGWAEIIVSLQDGRPARHVTTKVRDVSARGIGLLSAAQVPRGQEFVLHLPRRGHGWVDILCTVAHCCARGRHGYEIGAEFVCVMGGEDAATDPAELQRIRRQILS